MLSQRQPAALLADKGIKVFVYFGWESKEFSAAEIIYSTAAMHQHSNS